MESFGDWLQEELQQRGWKQADLARASHLDSAVISNLINNKRGPGEGTCIAIAHAFGYPPEFVYRIAGLLPELPSLELARQEILDYKLAELSEEELDLILQFIDFIHERKTKPKYTRQGERPGEVVK